MGAFIFVGVKGPEGPSGWSTLLRAQYMDFTASCQASLILLEHGKVRRLTMRVISVTFLRIKKCYLPGEENAASAKSKIGYALRLLGKDCDNVCGK